MLFWRVGPQVSVLVVAPVAVVLVVAREQELEDREKVWDLETAAVRLDSVVAKRVCF